jgi:hypothetical protein
MQWQRCFIGLMTLCISVSMQSAGMAQSRSSGFASLGEMGCMRFSGVGSYKAINEDVPIGREIFRSVAAINAYGGIDRDTPVGISCRLAPVNGKGAFKTLTLSFGLSQDGIRGYYLDDSVLLRLSIYRDGNFYKQQTFGKGELARLPIDIKGVRSIALEAECVRGKGRNSPCPGIFFVEDILKK